MAYLKHKKEFFVISIIVLVLTTFPLAQAWIGIGDFLPRLLFVLTTAFFWTQLYSSKPIAWLLVFFLYIIASDPSTNFVTITANFMEMAIPILIANFIFSEMNSIRSNKMAKFSIMITIIVMILTIFVNFTRPGIVREMVMFSANNEFEESLMFRRMGVANYSMALIVMCLIPPFLYMSQNSVFKKKRLMYLLFAIITFYFVYIAEVTTCLIITIYVIALSVVNNYTKSKHFILQSIVIAVLLLSFGFALADFAAPWFEGTAFETHIDGLAEFYGIRKASTNAYDIEERVNLYKLSLETFQNNMLLGDATGPNGGHNYFLDKLAKMGLVGVIPLFLYIYYSFRMAYYYIPKTARRTYLICIIAFLALGFLKNMAGIDYWLYMFLYIPCILKLTEGPSFKKYSPHS